jgi:putative serine protease PepD
MLYQLPSPNPRRALVTLSAILVAGAAGGALTSLVIDQPSTTTRVVNASTPISQTSGALTVSQIYNQAKGGVVDITATSQVTGLGPFGQQESAQQTAEGSGIVFDRNGDIVTNQHVVDGASAVTVKLADGTKVPAKVIGQDASKDIAVIRVESGASKLTPLTFAGPQTAQVGNSVVAMGSPYGLSGSLTVGVVSALDRTITSPNGHQISGVVQTDAPINPGNSGGPLLDSSGKVIGMNSQIESSSGGSNGVGFAIPASTVQQVAQQIIGSSA